MPIFGWFPQFPKKDVRAIYRNPLDKNLRAKCSSTPRRFFFHWKFARTSTKTSSIYDINGVGCVWKWLYTAAGSLMPPSPPLLLLLLLFVRSGSRRIIWNYLSVLLTLLLILQNKCHIVVVMLSFFFLIPRLPPLFGASLHRPRPRAHSYSLDCWMIEQTSIRIRFTRKHLAIWLLVQQMWPYRCRSQIRLCRSLDHQTVYIYVCMYQNSIRMSTYKTNTSTRVSIELIFCCRWLLSARLSPPPPPRLLRFRALISIEWMYVDTYLYI